MTCTGTSGNGRRTAIKTASTGAPSDGEPWISGGCETRVVRGGSLSAPAYLSRSAVRFFGALEFLDESAREMLGEFRNFNLGLRIARDLE